LNLIEVFGYVGDEIFRLRMLALNLPENFNGRFVWVDYFRGLGKRFLF
jgi:hypothetical protein